MPVIIKATEPAQLLSLFPAMLGYSPRDSVVILAFRGKRTCGTVRIDLPSSEHPEVFSRVALGAVGTVCKIPGADGVAFAVFTPAAFGDSAVPPRADFADILLDRIADSGLALKDGLCRADDGWASYVDGDVPVGGHPLGLLDHAKYSDVPAPPDQSDGRDLPDRVPSAGPGQRRQMRQRLDAIGSAIERIELIVGRHPDATDDEIECMLGRELDLVSATLDFATFTEGALEWTPEMLDHCGAMLLYGLTRPAVRDETMLQWAFGAEHSPLADSRAHRAVSSGNRSKRHHKRRGHPDRSQRATAPVDIGDRMTGFGPRPDPERMLRAIDILLYLIARADGCDRLAPLCMVAWLNWGLGRASHAAKYVGEVRAIDPAYGMGEVLSGVFTVYPLPEWAFAEPPA